MSGFTPGPWEAKCFLVVAPNSRGPMSDVYGGRSIAHCGKGFGESTECEANAQAISAMPDLLEACQRLVSQAEDAGWHPELLESARDAIAKALGT